MNTTTTSGVNLAECRHCGNYHAGQCPRVKSIEYYPDGIIKRVEYFGMVDAVSKPIHVVPVDGWTWPDPVSTNPVRTQGL